MDLAWGTYSSVHVLVGECLVPSEHLMHFLVDKQLQATVAPGPPPAALPQRARCTTGAPASPSSSSSSSFGSDLVGIRAYLVASVAIW